MGKKKRFLKKDLDVYKEKLIKLREDTAKELKQISEEIIMKSPAESSGDISSHSFHLADAAAGVFERDFSMGLASKEREIIRRIDSALHKIEESSYGNCEICNKPIPKRRLDALPYARYCLKCQKKAEESENW